MSLCGATVHSLTAVTREAQQSTRCCNSQGSRPSYENCLPAASVTLWSVLTHRHHSNQFSLFIAWQPWLQLFASCLQLVSSKQSEAEQRATTNRLSGTARSPVSVTKFSALYIYNFRDCFRRFGMKTRDWQVGLPHSPPVVQFTHSPTKLCPFALNNGLKTAL